MRGKGSGKHKDNLTEVGKELWEVTEKKYWLGRIKAISTLF